MIAAPIFHVNGDDPEACIRVARLAFAFRQEFNKDVVIDLICYRRRGHNEGDDPSFTQPLMYDLIEKKRSTRKLYTEALIGRGDITIEDAEAVMTRYQQRLESVFREVRDAGQADVKNPHQMVPAYPSKEAAPHGTAVTMETLKKIADAHLSFPDGFSVHPKVMPQLQRRSAAITQGGIDWGTAEILALGSLLMEGRTVRLTGQDSRRGTFVQRFASVVDRKTGESYVPLKHLDDDQGKFHIFDSLLSEYAAMGFEYGYSVARPDALVLWEAQFGDFANGAQTIIDEFISSGQAKWTQKSGVTLLLPHGYEGQGPDHSSARIERFLQLAAEDSIAVAQPSTPASHFHLLRQHAIGERHRPLVIMTPKSMLRNKLAVSQPEDFTEDRWRPVLADPFITDADAVRRVILCSGKVRWDLTTKRAQLDRWDTAIIPIERLYPLAAEEIAAELRKFTNVSSELLWVQDEPANQGAWPFMALNLIDALRAAEPGQAWTITPHTRPASSAPSVGSAKVHEAQQRELLDSAFR
jgi:2-oxoglutarate dehydrogenase E1 component